MEYVNTLYCGFGSIKRKIYLILGREYQIIPLNPNTKKHRDRIGILEDVKEYDGYAKIKYVDTGRPGRVGPSDLWPVERYQGECSTHLEEECDFNDESDEREIKRFLLKSRKQY